MPFKNLLRKTKSLPRLGLLNQQDLSPSPSSRDVIQPKLPKHRCLTAEEWEQLLAHLERFLDLALLEAMDEEPC